MKTRDFYDFKTIETKWRKKWADEKVFQVTEDRAAPKYYVLEMFIYPSGTAHMGHLRNYAIGDAYAWYKRLCGFNVLHPFGFDAFGLPAENAALKYQTHPETWTLTNIARIRTQLQGWGISYDWSREITTCLPEYYRWNQWLFVKMYERGLAYKKAGWVNWCDQCNTVLANEQVVNGCCWRHAEAPVQQKQLEQWALKITAYAEELLQETYHLPQWPEKVLVMQRNWIGKSDGAEVRFPVENGETAIAIFTTRIDTIYGANAILISPEHPLLENLIAHVPHQAEVRQFVAKLKNKMRSERLLVDIEKEGLFTGRYAVNPFSGERLPIWIANFVLMDYGTGAIMSVPAHDPRDFEFAKKYDLPIPVVIEPEGAPERPPRLEAAFVEYGRLVNSGPFSGMTSEIARRKMAEYAKVQGFGQEAITYRLKDWGISRQRFWGTPIPIVYCCRCGAVPVPEQDLPVVLPKVTEFRPAGGSPLAQVESFVDTKCPKCGGGARRETDTMDTFVDSSWYFYRYLDPKNDEMPFRPDLVKHWFPVDFYIGGIEHAILHLIYMRFITKVLRDFGWTNIGEPVKQLFTQGMVTLDGQVMSKSKGNIVDPDQTMEQFGVDTLRLYLLFAAPPEKDLDWCDTGIEGAHRFLNRVYRLVSHYADAVIGLGALQADEPLSQADHRLQRKTHETIRRVTADIGERLHLNTAVAAIMELVNELQDFTAPKTLSTSSMKVLKHALETLTLVLAPFTPHLSEELWSSLGQSQTLAATAWPAYDTELARAAVLEIPVQVNGKLRSRLFVERTTDDDTVKQLGLDDPKVKPFLEGKQIVKLVYVPKKLVNIVVS
ncbi:MAG: leucine--tRNA ligase [Acidobacteria bacterium]|nr:leucine--tRNA ligase [Acidobacteriota bacterium]MBI3657096.1 leucine--tRNA ligase [Acidobacteriota bacterium]